MGRGRSIGKRVAVAAVVLGGGLYAMAVSASAVAPVVVLTPGPTTGYTNGQAITVSGALFTPKAQLFVTECSLASGQPTISASGESLPVGCSVPVAAGQASGSGSFKKALSFTVDTGVVGPPATGTDTAGHSAATDAASYPCPPTAGGTDGCGIVVFDSTGVESSEPFVFVGTSPTSTTTSTTIPCQQAPNTVTIGDGATLTVDPATCLTAGEKVSVTGTGFTPGKTGAVAECSLTAGQPTVTLQGNDIPVSCSTLTNFLETVTPSGGVSASFPVILGTTGPPLAGLTDSAGNPAATDAAKYQCPSDVTTGAGCDIQFGDSATQNVQVPVTFVPNNPGSPSANPSSSPSGGSTTTAQGSTTKSSSGKSATKASSSSLAFTGTGPGLRWLGTGGLVLLVLGGLLLALSDEPRSLLRRVLVRRLSSPRS
jgi:hypothetical protein